ILPLPPRVAPALIATAPVPVALPTALFASSVPAEIVVPPVYVLLLVSLRLPNPDFVNELPAITPSKPPLKPLVLTTPPPGPRSIWRLTFRAIPSALYRSVAPLLSVISTVGEAGSAPRLPVIIPSVPPLTVVPPL